PGLLLDSLFIVIESPSSVFLKSRLEDREAAKLLPIFFASHRSKRVCMNSRHKVGSLRFLLLLPIFSRADAAQTTEHARKVFLRFEAAGNGDIQYARFPR